MNECIFCQIVAKKLPAHIVYEDSSSIAFLDKHPQTRGHLQLVPKKHYRWIYQVPEAGQIFSTATWICRGIIGILGADHVTLATYGHEIQHAHVWIVPQYKREIKGEWNKSYRSEENQGKLAHILRQTLTKEVSS